MEKIGKKLAKYLVVFVLLVLPFAVSASLLNRSDCNSISGQACNAVDINSLVKQIINLLLGVAGLISVMFIIIGGYRYITSAGNEELAEAGKKTLQNAIIGVIIVVLSFVIVNVISSILFTV